MEADHEIRAVKIHFLCKEVFGGGIVCGTVSSQVSFNRRHFSFFFYSFLLELVVSAQSVNELC